MTTITVSKTSAADLPQGLRTAQAAMHFPEVQEMLRRLSCIGDGGWLDSMLGFEASSARCRLG